jgi:hypothetical protein
MGQEMVNLVNLSSHVLVYATGNLVIDAGADTIAKTNAFTGITATPLGGTAQIVCASSEDAGNDGTHTLSAATASLLTTTSALTTNADDDAMTILGKYLSAWHDMRSYSRLVTLISTNQNMTFTTTWSSAASGTGIYTATTAITGSTPATVAVETLGAFVRFAAVNNSTAHCTATIQVYAKALT